MSKVFISYSHKDRAWKERLVKHLKVVELEGYYTTWDDSKIKAGEDWPKEIKTALNEAKVAVFLISADFLTSEFIREKEVKPLLERRQREGVRVIPLILSPCAWTKVKWLSPIQARPVDGKPLSGKTDHEIEADLSALAEEICSFVSPGVGSCESPDHISLSRMPVTDAAVFGREQEVELLDKAWNKGQPVMMQAPPGDDEIKDVGNRLACSVMSSQTNIVTLVAWGGVGKTALVNHWLNRMTTDHFRGAEKVYAWSFYSQGASEGKQASADEFLQETLRWFGDKDPTTGAPEEKGRRLAGLIRKSKTLLVLDGMEPLQYPPSKDGSNTGRLKDAGLRTLLKELAVSQPGLCVVTTREAVTDLSVYGEPAVKCIALEHLSPDAGTALLKHLGVHGREVELTLAVNEYGGHALALTLLGKYLCMGYDGDIRKRDTIGELIEEPGTGEHAKRMMQAYRHWLGESAELDILYMMGLFDRPVEKGAIEVLKTAPAIAGLTERLVGISTVKWNYAVNRLRELGLLAKEEGWRSGGLDCHPLVREYFGERLKEENPKGWKEAHTRLYEYYRTLPKKELPDTLDEMSPLFSAIAHGCLAGRHQEAMDEIYWKQIVRGKEAFINHKLGAFGADLSALSHFFDVPWERPASGLREGDKAAVLNWSAFGLRAVGRLREAVQPMKASVEMFVDREDWKNAAMAASNLSELLLTLGDVSGSVAAGRESVTHADRSGDAFMKETMRTTLADALHQSGKLEEAEGLFREAEEMQRTRQPGFHFLYSVQGYQFCDLLLENPARDKDREVMERAEKALEIAKGNRWLLGIALDHLTLGRAWMAVSKPPGNVGTRERANTRFAPTKDSRADVGANLVFARNFVSEPWTHAADFLDRAVTGLREAGAQHHLPRGLFARAACFRLRGDFASAWADLSEALEIAEAGDMKLHLCDYHLDAARLCRDEKKETEAADHERKAAELIEETGYYRRKILATD